MKEVDVAIIGAGTAGLSARTEVEKVTDSYMVIDPGPYGTTCARVGCMPSKVLIQVANDYHRAKTLANVGVSGTESLAINHQQVMEHVRSLRDRFVRSVLKGFESWRKNHLLEGKATFVDTHTLKVGNETIQAKKTIIATGSSPRLPKAWEPYKEFLIDTDDFFELETLPSSIGIIGLGVIGIEIGQALSRLGVEVKGFDIRPALGGITDPDILDYAIDSFNEEFPLCFDGAEVEGTSKKGIQIKSGDQTLTFAKVFLTMGRKPNLEGLGLEKLDLERNEDGVPLFNADTGRIKNTPLFLAGDVNNERPILHEAADEGRIAGYNSTRDSDQCFQRRSKLGIVFTEPNIASVGKSHRELIKEGANFITGKVSFEGQGRAILKQEEKGMAHIYAQGKTGKLLGAELFAPNGEHLAHLLSWAISLNLTASEALSLPFYHPVLEEGLRTALRSLLEQIQQIQQTTPPLEIFRCEDPPAGTTAKR